MDAARILRHARLQAGMSQRDVATTAGVPQSTVARIEAGRLAPRTNTLERLLRATGKTLEASRTLGIGIDRTQIRELLRLTPGQRARLAARDAERFAALEHAVRRPHP